MSLHTFTVQRRLEWHQKAIELAREYHGTQKDKNGESVFSHVMRVSVAAQQLASQSSLPFEPDQFYIEVSGILHDVVEDTDLTLGDLAVYFPQEIVSTVEAVTRIEGESYMNYTMRCKLHPLARYVKLADLHDHLALERIDAIPETHKERYRRALAKLERI